MGQLKILVHFYLSNLISFSTWYKNKTVLLKKTKKKQNNNPGLSGAYKTI